MFRVGNVAHYVHCDVGKLEDLKNLFNEAISKFGSFQVSHSTFITIANNNDFRLYSITLVG
jgi:NAD(P)-dependent dehydrogenase (short-subunit alcohol dehydrogenase family)